VLSRQHRGAFFKQSVIDLVALFTYNIETAFAHSKKVIMFTLNIQETFDAILKKQLLRYITEQGWPLSLL
jgi:hypothetical protein